MKALVTGATGFIGRQLVSRLQTDGADVLALVRNDQHGLPSGVKTIQGDLLHGDALGDAGLGCDRLYHLAALITFDPRRRADLMRINGEGTATILAAARRWKVRRSVVVSSACTLGISRRADEVRDENAMPADAEIARNPYLASKLETERIALEAAREMDVVVVNPTTVYGTGDRTLNSGALIRQIARSAVLPVPPGGGNVVDVNDVAAGIVAAGERGATGRRYVLGGENLTFGRIYSTIRDVTRSRPVLVPLPMWMRSLTMMVAGCVGRITGSRFLTPQIVGDMFAFKFYSSERARNELGWIPQCPFSACVEGAWAFYRKEGLI